MSRSFKYERYETRRRPQPSSSRSTFGYWVPLVVTVTVAAGGLAAWVWSSREDHESSTHEHEITSDDENLSYGEEARVDRPGRPPGPSGYAGAGVAEVEGHEEQYMAGGRNGQGGPPAPGYGPQGDTFVGGLQRGVTEVMRRTPSPQQAFDSAKRFSVAGIAAAGAAIGGALSAIREESTESRHRRTERRNEEGFSDHERWTEEAEKRAFPTGSTQYTGGRRKMVAIVVSSEVLLEHLRDDDGKYQTEHASLLSHIPPIDPSTTSLQILIYNPSPSSGKTPPRAPSSIASSYAAINTPAHTPGEELASLDPQPYTPTATTPALSARSSGGDFYDLLYKQAIRLVEDPVHVLPFETYQGWVHICKHMSPDLVYVVESLSGENGSSVEAVKGWVGQVVVVVGGDGAGLGGLVDTEDESDVRGKERVRETKWWVDSSMIGLGKGVEVVDGARFPEDWERRVGGKE